MTRDEFIDGYLKRSDLPASCRTEDGYKVDGVQARHALPCACGDDKCPGWAMVGDDLVEDHMLLYAPHGDNSR